MVTWNMNTPTCFLKITYAFKKREKTIMVLISDCFFRLWSLQLPHPKRQNRPLKREGSCLLEVRLSPSGPICSLKEGSAMLDLECKEAKLLWLWRPRGRSVCSTTWSLIPSWRSKIIKNKLKRRNMDLTQMPPASACNNNKCIPNNSESFHLYFDLLNLKQFQWEYQLIWELNAIWTQYIY